MLVSEDRAWDQITGFVWCFDMRPAGGRERPRRGERHDNQRGPFFQQPFGLAFAIAIIRDNVFPLVCIGACHDRDDWLGVTHVEDFMR